MRAVSTKAQISSDESGVTVPRLGTVDRLISALAMDPVGFMRRERGRGRG